MKRMVICVSSEDLKFITKYKKYYNENFDVECWENVEKELILLENYDIKTEEQMIDFINKFNELIDIVEQRDLINFVELNSNTLDKEIESKRVKFNKEIVTKVETYYFSIKNKIISNALFNKLPQNYKNYGRIISNDIELYNKENINLEEAEEKLKIRYNQLVSKMTINVDGVEKTIAQMKKELRDVDREKRETSWKLIRNKWLQEKETFEENFQKLRNIRNQIGLNAGFHNYRDYRHRAFCRLDYTPEDLLTFHNSIEKVIIPIIRDLNQSKVDKLKLKIIKPWDNDIDINNITLEPFGNVQDLINANIKVLTKINPDFAEKFKFIDSKGYLDLESRKYKGVGGFCCTVEQDGSCVISMNSVNSYRDIEQLIHESGHMLHSFATSKYTIQKYRMGYMPNEINKLASKTMELLALEHYDEIYTDGENIKQLKKQKLERVIKSFRRYAMIDNFQHWIYTNPNKSLMDANEYYKLLEDRFDEGVDWTGLDREKGIGWMEQVHIFTRPFYFIDYAIAQLGAIAIYKNYKSNKQRTLNQFIDFLNLGYRKSLAETYEAAGIQFDFSESYVKQVIDFILEELENLK